MISTLTYAMIYAGSALMIFNIYRYLQFAQTLLHMQGWEQERRIIRIPTLLLVLFLCGYLGIALFTEPELIIAFVLFGGSLFVLIMIMFIEHVAKRIMENEHLAAELLAAEESNRAKTSFLSTMSHEIRTPLNAIIGLNSLSLVDPDLSPATRDRLIKMQASANHLLSLINDVLDMSRIESGHTTLSNRRFDLHELLGQVNDMIGAQCAVKGLAYRYEELGALDPAYVGDDTKLKQVLINILGNAVKFTPAAGTVRLTAEQTASFDSHRTLRFTIADTGVGMDEGFLPKLFSVFTQEDDATTTLYGGTGLGMAITKNLVDMMNGTITVTSTKGVGTTFVVTVTLMAGDVMLSALEADATSIAAQASPQEGNESLETATATASDEGSEDDVIPEVALPLNLEGLHVLVAEDIEINAEILIDILDIEGIETDHAHNGKEAVELFEKSEAGAYDAILMDVRMPLLDGLEATKAIRKLDHPDAADIPIIALTANAFDEDMQNSLQVGMDAHLTKPIDPDQLYDTISRLVGERQS